MNPVSILQFLLREHQTNAARMSRELGFSNAVFSQWKRGLQQPSLHSLKKAADYFGVSLACVSGETPFLNQMISLMEERDCTCEELAAALKMPKKTFLGLICAGGNGFTPRQLEQIASLLGVQPAALLQNQQPFPPVFSSSEKELSALVDSWDGYLAAESGLLLDGFPVSPEMRLQIRTALQVGLELARNSWKN